MTIDKLQLFKFMCFTNTFSEINEVSLSTQGKQLLVFVPMIKFKLSSEN